MSRAPLPGSDMTEVRRMVLSLFRVAVTPLIVSAMTWGTVPAYAAAPELATANGTITISEARPGLRAASCRELVVEARDAIDDHLIAETQPIIDEVGMCRYALTVPAQTAVWLRLQPLLVAGVRTVKGVTERKIRQRAAAQSADSVALRFTIVARSTYFFAPNEQKAVPLNY